MGKRCILISILLILSCANRPFLPPVSSSDTNFKLEDDEKRLWESSELIQKTLHRQSQVLADPDLEAYLNGVARKLQPSATFAQIPFKVKVVKDRRLNACAFPNGFILIHTGILSQMESESQLAMLLSHEMTHATHRHMINQFRKMRSVDFILVSQIASSGYSRELETEADTVGFKLMVDAGYDPHDGMRLFQHLKAYIVEEKIQEPYFFGTHPHVQERIENFGRLALQAPPARKKADDSVFLKQIHKAILENARLNIESGKMKMAEKEAEKSLSIFPDNAGALTLLGKIYIKKEDQKDREKALAFFEKAITADPGYPDPYREKGIIHLKKGEKAMARAALENYLSKSGNPIDRKLIEAYIRECPEGSIR